MKRGCLVVGVICLLVGTANEARAKERSWLERGHEALLERDFARARSAFGQGLDQPRTPETQWQLLLGFALASELEGATLEAVYTYRRFLASARMAPAVASRAPWPARRERALSDVRRLEKRLLKTLAKVAIESKPSGASIALDGDTTEFVTPAVLYVESGLHQLRLEREGHAPVTLPFRVTAGEQAVLQPDVPRLGPVPRPAPPVVEVQEADVSPWMRFSAALSLAFGGALVLGGGVLHASALRAADELESLPPTRDSLPRDDTLRTRIGDYQTGYLTAYALGGAFFASGIGLLVANAVTPANAIAFIAPQAGGAQVGLTGRW